MSQAVTLLYFGLYGLASALVSGGGTWLIEFLPDEESTTVIAFARTGVFVVPPMAMAGFLFLALRARAQVPMSRPFVRLSILFVAAVLGWWAAIGTGIQVSEMFRPEWAWVLAAGVVGGVFIAGGILAAWWRSWPVSRVRTGSILVTAALIGAAILYAAFAVFDLVHDGVVREAALTLSVFLPWQVSVFLGLGLVLKGHRAT